MNLRSICLGLTLATLVGCASVNNYPKYDGHLEPNEFAGEIVKESLEPILGGSCYFLTLGNGKKKKKVAILFSNPKRAERVDNMFNVGDYVKVKILENSAEYKDHDFAYSLESLEKI